MNKIRSGPQGLHFFDRKKGLNILFDEVEIPHEEWSNAPRYMSIALTNACDLDCPYCYAPKHRARLAASEIVKWAVEIDSHGCLGVGFGGGEPTLYPGLPELCRDIAQKTGLAISMTTHGHRMTEQVCDKLSPHVNFVRISMDGIRGTYERLRGKSFNGLVSKIGNIRKSFDFGVNYVVNGDTIGELDSAAETVFELGASEFLLLPEVAPDGRSRLTSEQRDLLSDWVLCNYMNYRLSMSVAGSADISVPVLPLADPRGSTFDFLHIDASGLLKDCAFKRTGVSVVGCNSLMDSIGSLRETIGSEFPSFHEEDSL